MRIQRLDTTEWADLLPDTGIELFHDPAALSVIDDHATGDLQLFGGFEGDQPVALLPTVVRKTSVGTAVLSPPPGMGIPRLGPILMCPSPKRRKQERTNRKFVEGIVAETGAGGSLTLFRMLGGLEYRDPRPFEWQDFSIEPRFTYLLDLEDRTTDEVMKSFSKSLRRSIRDARESSVVVERGDRRDARRVFDDLSARYEEQDESYPLSWPYVADLLDALGDRARVYVVRSGDGEYLSGVVSLYSPEAAHFWLGGARTEHDVDVNSLLHWRVIEDIVEDPPVDTVSAYDLVGANTERLCRYKAKFGADLAPYYQIESGGKTMGIAKRAYGVIGG